MKKVNFSCRVITLFVSAVMMLCGFSAFAQNSVSGTVTDKDGEPLIGVSVIEKGTSHGVSTDLDGKYSLNVANGKTLVFTYVGFATKEVKVNGSVMNITLESSLTNLEEVVVIGYGQMSRKDVTSSITTIQSKDLNVGAYTDPAQLLQGKVPGLTIVQSSDPTAGTASISLRGASSLRTGAAMEPYYVIDGVPGVDLSLVAPDDIESIDVLRDASATAIYGSKAANGVIIVTTKKGKKDRTSVTYNGYIGVDNVLKNLKMMTADELRSFAKDNNIVLPNDEGASTNWQKEVLRTAISHNHNVSIGGGNEKTQYNASISYMNKQGIVRSTSFDRLGARAFVQTVCLNDRFTLALKVAAARTTGHTVDSMKDGASVFDAMNYYSPLVPVTNGKGGWYQYKAISQNYNPMSMVAEDTYNKTRKMIQGSAKASFKIIEGLVWHANFSYDYNQNVWNEYHSHNSQYRDSEKGAAKRELWTNEKKVLETYINFDRTFNEVHKLGLMAGYSWEEGNNNDGFGLQVYNFYNDAVGYQNLGFANKMDWQNGAIINHNLETLRMISFYGRVNYSFDSRYMIQATVRRDGSSAFGKNNRWGTFPSVSAAWRIAEEKFLKDTGIFSDLKLRVGYGVSGNSLGFGAYSALPTYAPNGWFTYIDENGNESQYRTLAAASNANPDLKWERTGMLNIGLDWAVLGGRLGGTIEYYDKKTSDLIYYYDVPTTRYPYGTMPANVGDIRNRGIEITLFATPVDTKDFTWTTNLNLSHNKNKVTSMSNSDFSVKYLEMADPEVAGNSAGGHVQRLMEGEPIGTFFTYQWAGYNDENQSVFYVLNEKGEKTGETTTTPEFSRDRTITGYAQPKLNLGWNNQLRYKNWSLDMFFTGVFGHKIYNATRQQYSTNYFVSEGRNILASFAKEHKVEDAGANKPSDRYLEKGDYFRLSNLTLSYNFGRLGKWLNNLKLYANCNNVFTITGYSGRDPEVNLGGLEPGMDRRTNSYPRTRTFMFGVNANF